MPRRCSREMTLSRSVANARCTARATGRSASFGAQRKSLVASRYGRVALRHSDNGELFIWPINPQSRSIALERGALMRTLSGGYRIEREDWRVRPPLELHMPHCHIRLDGEILDAVYRSVAGQRGDPHGGAALELSISWLAKAWRNTPSVSGEDRLIDLKTAFDALTGESSGVRVAHALRQRFEALAAHGVSRRSASHMLWRPGETERVRTVPDAYGQPQR